MNVVKKIIEKMRNPYSHMGVSYREIRRLKRISSPTTTTLFGKKIEINSPFWYIHGLNEIFVEEVYKFNSSKKSPNIIDCGANIGLSVLYFKRLFPESQITAFEADAEIAKILTKNLSSFRLDDVNIISKAVWNENTTLLFKSDGSVGGQITNDISEQATKIETVRLKDYLTVPVDFLKIDIEGAEYEILIDCKDNLHDVQNIFVEYHSFLKNEQMLDKILLILKNAGFRYYIKEAWNNQHRPYVNTRNSHYDLQLNIFGYRL
jgi:FkbM family methyltransferase